MQPEIETEKLRVFIGSSREGEKLARATLVELEDLGVYAHVWPSLFQPGRATWAELDRLRAEFDVAVLIMSPDDVRTSRGLTEPVPRDNLILELGLFTGALGSDRAFFLVPHEQAPVLPSDLAGIAYLTYTTGRPPRDAVRKACIQIVDTLEQRGVARDNGPTPVTVTEGPRLASIGVHRSDGRDHTEMWRVLSDGTLVHRWLPADEDNQDDWRWSDWEPIYCPTRASALAAVNGWPVDHAELFVLGQDGTVWHQWWSLETRWSDWDQLPALDQSSEATRIAAASKRPGRMDVYVERRDQRMYVYEFREGVGWRPPYALP
jgi:hypothetical protein